MSPVLILGVEGTGTARKSAFRGNFKIMTSNRFRFCGAATVASLAISLVLSACGPKPEENAAAESTAPSAPAAATAAPTALATPSRTATSTATAKAVAPSSDGSARPVEPAAPAPQVPARPVVPALKSFTFPDGHISFSYPPSWSVRTERGPGREGPPWQPLEAIVSDRTGADLFRVSSGADGVGCASGPTNRTVLDKAAVPGMREVDGTTPMFGFIVENSGQDRYAMAVMSHGNLQEGDVGSHCTLLVMGNGGAFNQVIFDQPPYPEAKSAFPNRYAAKAWMATEQYAQLKALIMSLKYS